jgi:Regulator of chromosome condensation (RCC1) repeat
MKDPGPSHPLPLHKQTGTKRKHIETQTPSTPATKVQTPDSPMSAASVDSKRSTASHRRNEEAIHSFPTRSGEKCEVFVFGAGSMGELGLGGMQTNRDVKRPRLNGLLGVGEVGVVDVAVGGMHVAAVDYEGRVWTWGVNDQGSLGRDTKSSGTEVMKDDEDDDEEELNPLESRPGLVQGFPEDVQVVKLACGDSISVAIASDGKVYSWGTFRVTPSPLLCKMLLIIGVRWTFRILQVIDDISSTNPNTITATLHNLSNCMWNRPCPRPQHNRKSLRLGKRPTIPNGSSCH